MKTLTIIDRLSAWGLFASMLLYFITGYGMTKGIIDASFATKLHLSYLTYFVLVFFVIHTFYAIHLALKRWMIWNNFSKFILIIFYLAFILSFFYLDLYYKNSDNTKVNNGQESNSLSEENSNSTTNNIDNSSTTTENLTPSTTTEISFTLSELAKYNGKNGQPAYVAVDGAVYDLTSVFANGAHFTHFAGTELTNAFYTKHAKSSISKYPVVGRLK